MKRLAPALLLIAALWCAAAPAALGNLAQHRLLDEANEAFRQGNALVTEDPEAADEAYARAIRRFERIVDEGGVRNGKLYYNLGNAHFLRGDLGEAIVNYLRAAHYRPQDPNLLQNLAYARSQRIDRIEEPARAQIVRTLLFFHYDLPLGVRWAIAISANAVFWLTLTVWVWRPRKGLTYGALAALVLLAAFGASAGVGHWQRTHDRTGVVTAEEATARNGDGESYAPAFDHPLHAGTEFVLIETRPHWHYIELRDGRRAWIPEDAAQLVQPGAPAP